MLSLIGTKLSMFFLSSTFNESKLVDLDGSLLIFDKKFLKPVSVLFRIMTVMASSAALVCLF